MQRAWWCISNFFIVWTFKYQSNKINFFCQDLFANRTYFVRKGLSLRPLICAMENKVSGRPNTASLTTQRVYIMWKMCLNLSPFRWLRSTPRRVRSFISGWLCDWKMLFCLGLIKFNVCFPKVSEIA